MSPFTVLLVGPNPPPLGGISTYVESLLRYPFSGRVRVVHVDTARNGPVRGNRLRHMLSGLINPLRVAATALRTGARVVHIHTSSYNAFDEKSVMVLLCRLMGRKVILHIHGAEFHLFYDRGGPVRKAYIRFILGCSQRVVALSQWWANYFTGTVGVNPVRVTVIPNGVWVPDGVPRREAQPGGPLTVLLLAVLEERKGIFEFLEAARSLHQAHSHIRFRVAGPCLGGPAAEAQLCQVAREAGLDDVLEWVGPVAGQAKWDCLSAADIFVIPSHAEGLPIVLLEAMAVGLPIVATPVGGIPEVVTDGQDALLVPVRDSSALTAAIHRLSGDKELRRRLGENAHRRVTSTYDFRQIGQQVETLYVETEAT